MKIHEVLVLAIILIGCSNSKHPNENSDSKNEPEINEAQEVQDESDEMVEKNDDCIFDVEYQTSDFLKGKFDNYEWNDSTKTATIITPEKDSLFITRGGCNHFEVAITLITDENRNTMDTVYWLNRGKEIASKVYNVYNYNLLDSLIEYKIYTVYPSEENLQVIFESGHDFTEFYTNVSPKEDRTRMELVYYFN